MPKPGRKKPAAKTKGDGNRLNPSLQQQSVARRRSAVKRQHPGLRAAGLLIGALGELAGLVLLVSVVLLGGWCLISSSRAFAVSRVEVLGTKLLSRLEVLRVAQVGADSNLLALPVGKIQTRLRDILWVREASLERRLPGSLRITIREREPLVLALVEGRLFYLDRELKPLAPAGGRLERDLPVLSGLSRADLVSPDEEMLSLLAAARRLLAELPPADVAPGGRLSQINLDRVWGLSLVYNDLAPAVRLGFGDFAAGLERLGRVRADLERRGELKRARLIDLESPRRIVVRLAGEAA